VTEKIRGVTFEENLNNSMGARTYNPSHRFGYQSPPARAIALPGKLVMDGKLGMKAGEGFRRWTPEQQQKLRVKVLAHLKKARA
jgi:hypothetical protein